ncbi:MAG: 4-hydroxy-tetrahydrodipicolinate synthase [Oscillospiraceae bacterium]|nr:4-hydroxy-tetrahydrodipicolinate synthase [Oscillospiraceae bacterium]
MKLPVFTGSATALVTPYDDTGIDYELLDRVIERQAENGTAALVICATTGESPVLTEQERTLITGFCVRHAAGRMKVIVCVGGNDTQKAARAAGDAEILGADAVLLTTPYYNKANREGLCRHFTAVADRTGLPVIAYNVPGRTGVACTAEIYQRLAEHPRLNGVKEASGDISLVSKTIARCGDAFNVWSGNDDQTLPMMALGAKGAVSVASNVDPAGIAGLCEACLRGDLAAAGALHRKYQKLFETLFTEVNPIPVKAALTLMGLDHGVYRLPLAPMEENHLAALEDCLKELGLIS